MGMGRGDGVHGLAVCWVLVEPSHEKCAAMYPTGI